MWLAKQDRTSLLQKITERFSLLQLVLEMVPEKYTKGIWKSSLRLNSREERGLDVAWVSDIRNPHDLKAYGNSLKLIGVEKDQQAQ